MNKISAAEIKELMKADISDIEELTTAQAAKETGISVKEAEKLQKQIDSRIYDSRLKKRGQ